MTHAEDIYFFSHAVLQQAAYQLLPPSVRARLHEVTAELLTNLPEPPPADIAMHARLAQEGVTQFDDRLLKLERHWVGRAGEAAEAAYRIQDALRFYQRLTEILAAGASEQIRVRCRITDLLMQLDRTTEALPLADKAVVDARQLNDVRLEATALSALGAAVRDGTRNTESVDYFRNSVSLFRKTDDEAGLAKALLGLAGSLWTKGQLDDAEHAATEACEIADRSADTKTRAGAWMNRLGIVLHAQRFEEAESLIAKLAIIVGDSPDPALRMRLHAFRGYAMDVMGH
ncbi:MAG: tetratricopeptide repeat protein, partial [Planctomycetes bacterium]|nr:tetratricopeptide repeat protein [Planctomycetota bacterium]